MFIAHIIIFCVALLYSIVGGVGFAIDETDSYPAWISLIVSTVLTFVLGILLVVGCVCLNHAEPVVDDSPYKVEHITALNDNNLTQGDTYIRRGHIDENLYYQYLTESEDGGFKSAKVSADNATLFETTDNYRVEKYHETKKWLYFESQSTRTKIYIPKGSITDEFEVQLE